MRSRGAFLIAALVALLASSSLSAVAADPPTVTIHADRSIYVAGQTAAVDFRVDNVGSGTTLKIVLTYANGHTQTQSTGAETNGETFRYHYYMYVDTRIDAYMGAATEPSSTLRIPVRAAVGIAIAGYYQRSGSYAVFAHGSSPTFRSATVPPRLYRCIRHEVWRRSSSGWIKIGTSPCKSENSQGYVNWTWAGAHSSSYHYRVRARFLGDSWNHANSSKYIYFRFA